jgi:Flp pilus assembly protein TadB
VVAAKVAASMLAGAGAGLLAEALNAGAEAAGLALRGIEIQLGAGDYSQLAAGGALAGALSAAIGVGVGAVVRQQVGAVVGLCVWLLLLETTLIGNVPSAGKYAPGAAAGAIADALAGGHSLRGALQEAGSSVDGAAGHELRRVGAELAAGAPTADALEALRARARSEPVDVLVAACLLQRRSGGDLAGLLRGCARSFEERARLEGEVRAATAQARFTGLLVILLPLGGGFLAELASPGWFVALWSSLVTAWLVGIALALQLVAAVLIRRLGRVRL